MPYFAQEPLSYLTLPTIRNAYKTFNIKVTFRPDNVDGERAGTDLLCIIVHFSTLNLERVCVSCYLLSCLSCFHMFTFTRLVPPPSLTSLGGKVWYCTLVSLKA